MSKKLNTVEEKLSSACCIAGLLSDGFSNKLSYYLDKINSAETEDDIIKNHKELLAWLNSATSIERNIARMEALPEDVLEEIYNELKELGQRFFTVESKISNALYKKKHTKN